MWSLASARRKARGQWPAYAALTILAALAGCVTRSDQLASLDRDGDGVFHEAAAALGEGGPFDCDDDDDAVYPGAVETCNGIDDNCDDNVDDGDDRATLYGDADLDGYGTPASTQVGCAPTAGWAAEATDCDDKDALSNPGAVEVCDEQDNDCDDLTDEGLATSPFYADRDLDGYGDDADIVSTCGPEGYADRGGDCDDDRSEVHPDALEYCNLEDDDCDGAVDEDAVDPTTWYHDADGDGYGYTGPNALIAACERPGLDYVDNDDDCDWFRTSVYPDTEERDCFDSLDNDCDGAADEADSDC